MFMLIRYIQITIVALLYLQQVSSDANTTVQSFIDYHVIQECSKRIMAEFIIRESLCQEYNQKNKQKILQNIITSQLIINNQKIELDNISEIIQLVEQIKPLEKLTKDSIQSSDDLNELNFINQMQIQGEPNNIKAGQLKQKKQENIVDMIEDSINEESYFIEQQEQMKQYQSYFKSKLSLLEDRFQEEKENENVIENDQTNQSSNEQFYDDLDQYNQNQITKKQEKDPNFWKQQLEWLQESFQNEKNNYESIISQLKKDKDILNKMLNNIKNQNEKLSEQSDLNNLLNFLDTINLDLEHLKLIQGNNGSQQKDL